MQAVKVAGAEQHIRGAPEQVNETRRRAAMRARCWRNSLSTMQGIAVTFGVGVMLLLAGQAMAAGRFTVGDFALFTYYLWFTAELPPTWAPSWATSSSRRSRSPAWSVIPGEPPRGIGRAPIVMVQQHLPM